jgi:hypothetical protein
VRGLKTLRDPVFVLVSGYAAGFACFAWSFSALRV